MTRQRIAATFCAGFALMLASTVTQTSCSKPDPITTLGLAVDAVGIALPLLGPSAGLPADLQAKIQTALEATRAAIAKTADILSGPGDDASKAARITALFVPISIPFVPAQYQGIAGAVAQVTKYVGEFLATLPTPSSQPLALRAPGSRAAVPGETTKLITGQLQKLAAIKQKALTIAQ